MVVRPPVMMEMDKAGQHIENRTAGERIDVLNGGTTLHVKLIRLAQWNPEMRPLELARQDHILERRQVQEHTKSNLSAQEVVELLDSQGFFELLKMTYPMEQSGVLERLDRERLIDRVDGSYAIRGGGGVLLFGVGS